MGFENMPLQNRACNFIEEIDADFTLEVPSVITVSLYSIFDSFGTTVSKISNNGLLVRGFFSENINGYTILYDTAGVITQPASGAIGGLAWGDMSPIGAGQATFNVSLISVPLNAGLILDPGAASPTNVSIIPSIPNDDTYSSDFDGFPASPFGWNLSYIVSRGTSSTNYLVTLNITSDSAFMSAFENYDTIDNSVYDNVQSYTDGIYCYVYFDNFDSYPAPSTFRIKQFIPAVYPAPASFDITWDLQISENSDLLSMTEGTVQPCQNTGMFGQGGDWFNGGPYYLYGILPDGTGYYRYNIIGDATFYANMANSDVVFIIHTDGIYAFEDRFGNGSEMWIYRYVFPTNPMPIKNYPPIKLPCHPNCIPVFDKRKFIP